MDTQKLEQALEMARCADAEPRGEPVAWNQTAYAALQQARLALEDLDGPGYLIGGVMHHRIGLILPMLNAAMESLIDHPPQQRKPLSDEQIYAAISDQVFWATSKNFIVRVVRDVEAAHGITGGKE